RNAEQIAHDRVARELYDTHMNRAQSAYEDARLAKVLEWLNRYLPKPGGEDLCGFEWYYWKRLTETAVLTWRGHGELVRSVVFSPDGKGLGWAREDRTVKVWDAATGQEFLTLKGHTREVVGVAFSPDGRRLASASLDRTVKVWDAATGHQLLSLK